MSNDNYRYPIPPSCSLFTRKEWQELQEGGAVTVYDGVGWPTKDGGCDRFQKMPGHLPEDADGVAWLDTGTVK